MFAPTLLALLRLLPAHPEGVSREVVKQQLEGTPPEWVDRALDRLLEAGVIAERDDLVVPLPGLKPLAQKMERIASHINRQERERDLAMGLVRLIMRGPAR